MTEKNRVCSGCDGLGYVEHSRIGSGSTIPTLQKCHVCKEDQKYFAEVSRRYAKKPLGTLGDVLKFSKKQS